MIFVYIFGNLTELNSVEFKLKSRIGFPETCPRDHWSSVYALNEDCYGDLVENSHFWFFGGICMMREC